MERTGISLGGGSLRGVAHVGVLKEFINSGIEITHLAGTSAGSVIGGLFACGMDPEKMARVLRKISIHRYIDVRLNRKGWIKGDRIYNTLLKLTDGKHFSDLALPFAVVCVDLLSGELVVLTDGEVALAIRASIAIPGLFSPVEIDGKLLVDGYILNNNPADIVRMMGAEKVTSVRVRSSYQQRPANLLSFVNRYIDIASQKNTERCINNYADLLIDIDLRGIGRFEPRSLAKIIEIGQLEARKALLQSKNEQTDNTNIVYLDNWLQRVH